MNALVYCDICTPRAGAIAVADIKKLSVPLTGEMFGSTDPEHGLPSPFHAAVTWQYMTCPRCRKRPFTKPDKIHISNDKGHTFFEHHVTPIQDKIVEPEQAPDEQASGNTCYLCGKVCATRQGLKVHIRVKHSE